MKNIKELTFSELIEIETDDESLREIIAGRLFYMSIYDIAAVRNDGGIYVSENMIVYPDGSMREE